MKSCNELISDLYSAHEAVVRANLSLAEYGDSFESFEAERKLEKVETRFDLAVNALRERIGTLESQQSLAEKTA